VSFQTIFLKLTFSNPSFQALALRLHLHSCRDEFAKRRLECNLVGVKP